MGWNYAMGWMTVFPFELVAAGLTVQFWNASIPSAVFITIFWLAVVVVNLIGVRGYGEVEFVLSIIKVTAVIGFIILGIVIDVGGSPSGIVYGTTFWRNPGSFNNGFKGVCSVFVTAAFAYAGTELAGLTAAETVSLTRMYLTAGKSSKDFATSNQTSHMENYHLLSRFTHRDRLSRTLYRAPSTPQSLFYRYQSLSIRYRCAKCWYQGYTVDYERRHPHLCSICREFLNLRRHKNFASYG